MKIENILEYEAQNNDTVILFKEGIFLRAYERSAMRFTEHIAPFKVFKKFYKIVNAEACYLGFPMKSVRMLFQKVNITRFADMAEFMVVYGCPSKENFEVWKAGVQPCSRGVRYLGVYVTPWGIFPSHRLRQHFKDFLTQNDPSSAPVSVMDEKYQFQSAYNSYFGMWHHIHVYKDFLERTEMPHLSYLLCGAAPLSLRHPRELRCAVNE